MLLQDLHDDRVGWVAGTILVAPASLLGRGRRLWMRTRAGLRHPPPKSKAGANPGTLSLPAYPRSSSLRRVLKRDSACPIVGLQRAANVSVTSQDGRALVSASRQGTEKRHSRPPRSPHFTASAARAPSLSPSPRSAPEAQSWRTLGPLPPLQRPRDLGPLSPSSRPNGAASPSRRRPSPITHPTRTPSPSSPRAPPASRGSSRSAPRR